MEGMDELCVGNGYYWDIKKCIATYLSGMHSQSATMPSKYYFVWKWIILVTLVHCFTCSYSESCTSNRWKGSRRNVSLSFRVARKHLLEQTFGYALKIQRSFTGLQICHIKSDATYIHAFFFFLRKRANHEWCMHASMLIQNFDP